MKILLAVHHFPPNYIGGAEKRAYRTAAAMQELGHEVIVVYIENTKSRSEQGLDWEDDQYRGVKVRRLSFDIARLSEYPRWEFDNRLIGDHIERMLIEFQIDVLHLIGGYLITTSALNAAYRHEIPTVVSITDYWYLCPRITMLRSNGGLSQLPIDPARCTRCIGEERRRYRWPGRVAPGLMNSLWRMNAKRVSWIEDRLAFQIEALNKVDTIIAPSEFVRSMYIDAGVESSRIHHMRQGRNFHYLERAYLEKIPTYKLRLGFIGQLAPHKGIHLLIEAFLLIPDTRLQLFIYGDEEQFPKYVNKLKKRTDKEDRIHWKGSFHDEKSLTNIFRGIDVLVVPSLWYENSPNTILEAFAHKTPVICTELGGMAELVKNDVNGLTFQPGSVQDLSTKLQRLADHPSHLAKLRSGIEPIKTLGEEMDELQNIYEGLYQSKIHKELVT
jgi:glycosyltransferase involved in cell wall biosynthesis